MTVLDGVLLAAVFSPAIASGVLGLAVLIGDEHPAERTAATIVSSGLVVSALATATVLAAYFAALPWAQPGEIDYGDWLRIGDYSIPTVFLVDGLGVTISVFAAALTALIASFSRTYLHREPGFVRFFGLLGVFATGTQLLALAGALELFFAGWELIGVTSALFIGFFHERAEPLRSSVRAFATYRFADAGLLLATVTAFEYLGSARFSAFGRADTLPAGVATIIALLLLLSAMGKSAQLPFSGWLPRAMEGPTPSSALFYGAVSIHAGLVLLLRVWPMLEVSVPARVAGVVVGLGTAAYAALVVRVHTDAKGALAHATLAQVGLILAEICVGWTRVALAHLVCHALLRLGQYLKAPNTIHDTHRRGHAVHGSNLLATRMYALALHRFRLDDRIDAAFAPAMSLARGIDWLDRRLRRLVSLEPPTP